MSFNDANLKRLKEINDVNRNIEGMMVVPVGKIEVLLALLEAAESAHDATLNALHFANENGTEIFFGDDWHEKDLIWRKASGK